MLLPAEAGIPAYPITTLEICITMTSTSLHVLQGRKFRSPGLQGRQIHLGADDSLVGAGIGQNYSVGIDDQAVAIVGETGIGPGTVHTYHVGLVFNRSRLQERDPMLNPLDWPVGNDREELRLAPHCRSEKFRKA